MKKIRLLVTVDPGDDHGAQYVEIHVDSYEDIPYEAINRLMLGGVYDNVTKTWYPSHQIRKVDYGTS